jgi:hypothetical protein
MKIYLHIGELESSQMTQLDHKGIFFDFFTDSLGPKKGSS